MTNLGVTGEQLDTAVQRYLDATSATATQSDVKSGKTFVGEDGLLDTGTLPTYTGSTSVTPTTSQQTLATAGKYVANNIVIGAVSGGASLPTFTGTSAAAAQILSGYQAVDSEGNLITGTMRDGVGGALVTTLTNYPYAGLTRVYAYVPHDGYWTTEDYLCIRYSDLVAAIGLTPDMIASGSTVLGVTGTGGGGTSSDALSWSVGKARSTDTYTFTPQGSNTWVSNNQTVSSSAAICRITFVNSTSSAKTATITFSQDSEVAYDYSVIGQLDSELATSPTDTTTNVYHSLKNETSYTYNVSIPANSTHFLDAKYCKDSSVSVGTDTLTFTIS